MGVGLRPTWKRVELPPNPKRCARLISIPITTTYTHVLNRDGLGVKMPMDRFSDV